VIGDRTVTFYGTWEKSRNLENRTKITHGSARNNAEEMATKLSAARRRLHQEPGYPRWTGE
jgi:hypothetical protein